jgi:biotin operon repressor
LSSARNRRERLHSWFTETFTNTVKIIEKSMRLSWGKIRKERDRMPYQQIDKEHYPQLYKNKRQRVVLSAIGTGREQGAHLRDLHRATGFGERSVRKVIEDIRRAGVVVCNSLDGYFFPETLDELRLYVRQEERRGRSTFYTLGSARRLLQELEELTGNEELEEV